MELYLVRHGQTEWNKNGIMQGRLDSPLTDLGKNQAAYLGKRLSGRTFHAVYASPTYRAHHTARIIFEGRKQPIHLDARLKEIDMGNWEGMSFKDAQAREPEQFKYFCEDPHLYDKPGAETYHALKDRVSDFIQDIEKRHKDEEVVVVTHGATLLAFIMHYQSEHLSAFWERGLVPPASITHISVRENRGEILAYGDHSHYSEVLDEV